MSDRTYARSALIAFVVFALLMVGLSVYTTTVADRANGTADRVDRNTKVIAHNAKRLAAQQEELRVATRRVDELRRTVVRQGFLLNCRAIRELAKDHEHLGEGRRLAHLPCERLAQRFLGAKSAS